MRRLATQNDFQSAYDIYMDPSVNPFMSWEFMSSERFRPIYQELLARHLRVWEKEGQVAGLYIAERRDYRASHVMYVGKLAVSPKFRRQGIGHEMMNDLISECREIGVKRIELYAETDNKVAIPFYEKLGFKIEGTLKNYFKRQGDDHYTDEYVMGLILSD